MTLISAEQARQYASLELLWNAIVRAGNDLSQSILSQRMQGQQQDDAYLRLYKLQEVANNLQTVLDETRNILLTQLSVQAAPLPLMDELAFVTQGLANMDEDIGWLVLDATKRIAQEYEIDSQR